MTRTLWHRLIAFGFRLLYNELAWLYDPVSWITSLGRWRLWQKTIWPYLPGSGRILEVGFGPGHLLVDLTAAGYTAVGLDLSPAMLRLARRKLRRLGRGICLCRGRAEALPFMDCAFDAVVLTFPTPFVYDLAWLEQMDRVLKRFGRFIVVEMASFEKRSLRFRLLEWVYRVTGQRGPTPDLPQLVEMAGLSARRETVAVAGTSVSLVVAEWQASATAPPSMPVNERQGE